MKIKANKILAVLCVIAMIMTMIVPMTLTAAAADTEVEFNLGANGSASHYDGSEKSSYSETVDGYTLNITGGTKMYTGARDAKGNSCIKLGTGSAAGGFSFTVPDDVTTVHIEVAKYKTNTSKLTVNGTSKTLSGASNNGEYDVITVDTSATKTVTLTTVSGGYRAMVNTISFVIPVDDSGCVHEWVLEGTTPATCTTAGEETYTCSKCSEGKTEALAATGHDWDEGEVVTEADCTTAGTTTYTCNTCGETEDRTVLALGHNVVNGACTRCGEKITEATITFDDAAKRTTSTTTQQIWEESGIVITYNKGSYTNNLAEYNAPVRFYKGTEVIVTGTSKIAQIVFNCNSSAYATELNNSISGNVEVDMNEKVVTVTLDDPSDSFTVTMGAQVRVDSIKVVYAAEEDPTEDLNKVEASMSLAYKYAEEDGNLVDSMFVFKCAVDASLANIEGVDAYGIAVTVGEKTVFYTSENATSWKTADDKFYVSIRLGDIINDTTKLGTEFKVRAFVTIDDVNYYSELDKTYSVASAVKEYYTGDNAEVTAQVEHLYNILAGYGLYN